MLGVLIFNLKLRIKTRANENVPRLRMDVQKLTSKGSKTKNNKKKTKNKKQMF